MFDVTAEIDELRTHTTEWLHDARDSVVREQRRLRARERAITLVLDERGAIDDSLAARDGISLRDFRANVQTARTLEMLPHLAAAGAEGRLSEDQMNSAVQLADQHTDEEWADRAEHIDPAELRRQVRAQKTPTVDEARRRRDGRSLRYWWNQQTGMLDGRFSLPDVEGAAFESVIQQVTERMKPGKGRQWERWDRRAADALTELVKRYQGDSDTLAEGVRPNVVVSVRSDGPAEVADGVMLADEQVEQMRANCTIELAFLDEHGSVTAISRATTALSPKVRRSVIKRDGRCRWPGCEVRDGLEVHHIRPRSCGGTDEFTNLVAVCAPHHRLLVPLGEMVLAGNPNDPGGIRLVRACEIDWAGRTDSHRPGSGPDPGCDRPGRGSPDRGSTDRGSPGRGATSGRAPDGATPDGETRNHHTRPRNRAGPVG